MKLTNLSGYMYDFAEEYEWEVRDELGDLGVMLRHDTDKYKYRDRFDDNECTSLVYYEGKHEEGEGIKIASPMLYWMSSINDDVNEISVHEGLSVINTELMGKSSVGLENGYISLFTYIPLSKQGKFNKDVLRKALLDHAKTLDTMVFDNLGSFFSPDNHEDILFEVIEHLQQNKEISKSQEEANKIVKYIEEEVEV